MSSLSHYNIDKVRVDKDGKATRLKKQPDGTEAWINEDNQIVPEDQTTVIKDDFDEVCDCIRSTVDDF